jgi:arylsulfatase A-like enzyme
MPDRTMNRRQCLARLAAGAAGAAFGPLAAAEPRAGAARPQPPNIVLIVADDLGYGHPGCYGQEKIRTPSLDRLAAEGMRFTQFYAGYTVCAPSRSVLMTGLHHGHTPVRANSGSSSLLAEEGTVAQVLKKAGYATGGFGKWGLGLQGAPGQPSKKGFDEFYGFYHQVHAHFYYPYWIWHNDEKLTLPGNIDQRGQYVDDVLHGKTLAFIRDCARKKRPFFCYVPTIIPHVELAVPEESARPYRGKFPKTTINDPRKGYLGSDDAYAVYAGMIGRMDRNVGQVLDLLKELGIDSNTLVIFTSDNGPQGGPWEPLRAFFAGSGPLRGGKGSLYEGGIRVPFIARWPGKVRPGSVSDHVGGFQDMMPTLAELAGAQPLKTDGLSIVPTLLGRPKQQKPHEYLFWGGGRATAVRMGKWKAVRRGKGPWQLYDLSKDIGESNDLAAANPDVVKRIQAIAAEAYTPPRPQQHGRRVNIRTFVRGARIDKKNAR